MYFEEWIKIFIHCYEDTSNGKKFLFIEQTENFIHHNLPCQPRTLYDCRGHSKGTELQRNSLWFLCTKELRDHFDSTQRTVCQNDERILWSECDPCSRGKQLYKLLCQHGTLLPAELTNHIITETTLSILNKAWVIRLVHNCVAILFRVLLFR